MTRFSWEPVFDESHTDWCGTRYDVEITCILNLSYLSTIAPDLVNMGPPVVPLVKDLASAANVIRSRLMRPRRTLSIVVNGVDMIPQKAGVPGSVDIENGPRPKPLVFEQLTNTTFFVQFGVEATYWDNTTLVAGKAQNNPGSPVLYNRWEESVEIDECLRTRKTRKGKVKIRSDNVEGKTVDRLRRDMAVIGIPDGFRRVKSSYTVSPDGLSLAYELVDQEEFRLPPKPAYKAECFYTESAPVRGGAKKYAEVKWVLWGSKDTPMELLILAATSLVASKLALVGGPVVGAVGAQRGIPESFYIKVVPYDQKVEAYGKVMLPIANNRIYKFPVLKSVASFPGIDSIRNDAGRDVAVSFWQPPYSPRGDTKASILLQAAAYWDPSLIGVLLDQKLGQFSKGKEVGEAGSRAEP